MGFREEKKLVIHCLRNGLVTHEERDEIDSKNLLATGKLSLNEVKSMILRSNGNNHTSSPHHMSNEVLVNILKVKHQGNDWYIKWYFLEPNAVFISVHED